MKIKIIDARNKKFEGLVLDLGKVESVEDNYGAATHKSINPVEIDGAMYLGTVVTTIVNDYHDGECRAYFKKAGRKDDKGRSIIFDTIEVI